MFFGGREVFVTFFIMAIDERLYSDRMNCLLTNKIMKPNQGRASRGTGCIWILLDSRYDLHGFQKLLVKNDQCLDWANEFCGKATKEECEKWLICKATKEERENWVLGQSHKEGVWKASGVAKPQRRSAKSICNHISCKVKKHDLLYDSHYQRIQRRVYVAFWRSGDARSSHAVFKWYARSCWLRHCLFIPNNGHTVEQTWPTQLYYFC